MGEGRGESGLREWRGPGLFITHIFGRGVPQNVREAVRWSNAVRWTDSHEGEGVPLLRQACRDGTEGIIGKHADSRYSAGRSSWWVKIKCLGRQEFVIGGYTDPQRSRVGLGALLVGYYGDDGKRLVYAGKVGTGYNSETLRDLRSLGITDCPVTTITVTHCDGRDSTDVRYPPY